MLRGSVSIIAVIIASVFILGFILITMQFSHNRTTVGVSGESFSYNLPTGDTAFGGIFYKPQIDGSLPYYQYKRIEDSAQRIKERIKFNNKSVGSGMLFGPLGLMTIKNELLGDIDLSKDPLVKKLSDSSFRLKLELVKLRKADSILLFKKLLGDIDQHRDLRYNELMRQQEEKKETFYYLSLNGYKKKNSLTEFFLDKGTNNLAYIVVDSIEKDPNNFGTHAHYERKRITVRYAADAQRVFVPLTRNQYQVISVIFRIAVYGTLFLLIYILFGLPIQIVVSISRGKAFTLQNIQRFKLIAFTLLIISLITLLVPYLLSFFFRHTIPEELVLKPFWETLVDQLPVILSVPGVFLIGKAFERGYKLQQENILTI